MFRCLSETSKLIIKAFKNRAIFCSPVSVSVDFFAKLYEIPRVFFLFSFVLKNSKINSPSLRFSRRWEIKTTCPNDGCDHIQEFV